MNQQELEELREIIASRLISTHYRGCWRVHGWCAVERVLDAWEAENVVRVDDEGNVVNQNGNVWIGYQWMLRQFNTENGSVLPDPTVADTANTPEADGCDHMIYDTEYGEFYPAKVWAYDYCPKCGEKL
jgi:hypothetical protein